MATKKPKSPAKIHEDLTNMVATMGEDVEKLLNGNKAAGRRLRKALQDIKKEIKPWRLDIQEYIQSIK